MIKRGFTLLHAGGGGGGGGGVASIIVLSSRWGPTKF